MEPLPLVLLESLDVREALERVLNLPSVASKRYLTNKVKEVLGVGVLMEDLCNIISCSVVLHQGYKCTFISY